MQARLPTVPQVDQALRRVYARPELQPPPPRPESGFTEWRRRLFARIGEFFERFGDLRGDSPVFYWLVIALLAAAGIAIIVYLLRNTLARLEDGDGPGRGTRAPGPVGNARARTAAEWDEEARRAAAAGRYREAAVALYQALLLRLEAAGALRYDPAKTPGDYRRETRRDPRAAGVLAAFLRGFEPVVFGGRALDGAGYERLRAAMEGGHGEA